MASFTRCAETRPRSSAIPSRRDTRETDCLSAGATVPSATTSTAYSAIQSTAWMMALSTGTPTPNSVWAWASHAAPSATQASSARDSGADRTTSATSRALWCGGSLGEEIVEIVAGESKAVVETG